MRYGKKMALASVLSVALAFAPPLRTSAADAQSQGPRELVARAIAYEISGQGDMRSRRFLQLFSPRLRAAMVKDMAGPELWVIDMDVLCQTQSDCVAMRLVSITTRGNNAVAKIASTSVGGSPDWAEWTLQQVDGHWYIADIRNAHWASFLAELQKNNRLH